MKHTSYTTGERAATANVANSRQWIYLSAGAAIIVLATLAAYVLPTLAGYSNSLRGYWLWDDEDYIPRNTLLKDWDGLGKIWFSPTDSPQYYPMVFTGFWIEYHLWELNPIGYHVINVLLHATNALLVWIVLRRLKVPGAWLAAAIFALHPVQVESVVWIVERKNVLSTLFFLLSLLAYLRFAGIGGETDRADEEPAASGPERRKGEPPTSRGQARKPVAQRAAALPITAVPSGPLWGSYALAIVFFICALLSKTMVCTLPAVILVILWWKKGAPSRRDLALLAPLFVIAIVMGLITIEVEKHHMATETTKWTLSPAQRVLIAGRAVWFYAGKLLWPSDLLMIYPRWLVSPDIWWQWVLPAAVIAAIAALWLLRKRIGVGAFVAALCFVGTLAPTLGFVDVGYFQHSFVADHFQYLSSIALIAAFVAGIAVCLDAMGTAGRAIGVPLTVLVLLALGLMVPGVADPYENQVTLWNDTLARNPNAWMAHYNLGTILAMDGHSLLAGQIPDPPAGISFANRAEQVEAYRRQGLYLLELARPHLEAAGRINPLYARAFNNLGLVLAEEGKMQEALPLYRKSLDIDDTNAEAHNNYALALVRLDRDAEGIPHFKRAIALNPHFAEAYNNLAQVYLKENRPDEAIDPLKKAIEINPNYAEARMNLGIAYAAKNQYDRALQEYFIGIQLLPRADETHNGFVSILLQKGKRQEAEAVLRRMLQADYSNPVTENNLGVLLTQTGRSPEAVPHLVRALEIAPTYAEAHDNLGIALAALGRIPEALSQFFEAIRLRPDWPPPASHAAGIMATHPEAKFRDGAEAVRLAELAARLSGNSDPLALDTLAAAYAEAGRFPDAVKTARQAIDLANQMRQPQIAANIQIRLEQYEAGKPWREPVRK